MRRRVRRAVPGHPRWVGYCEVVRVPSTTAYSAQYERRVRIGRVRVWIWRAGKLAATSAPGWRQRRQASAGPASDRLEVEVAAR